MKSILTVLLMLVSATSAFAIEAIKPEDNKGFSDPRWIVGSISIVVGSTCRIVPASGISYPYLSCSPPSVYLHENPTEKSKTNPARYATLTAGGASVTTSQSFNEGQALFRVLISSPNADAVLTVEENSSEERVGNPFAKVVSHKTSKQLRLLDFADQMRDYSTIVERTNIYEVKAARKAHMEKIALIVILAIVLLLVVIATLRGLRFALARSKTAIARGRAHMEDRRIRLIAEEEVIRATVRKSIDDSDEIDLAALKERIKDALDSGDVDTAGTLTLLLKSQLSRRGTTITTAPSSEPLALSNQKN